MLLVRHKGIGKKGFLWSPPGGEPRYGEGIDKALKREFFEETGLLIEKKEFLFINEYIEPPLHAVELFFRVEKKGGSLFKGSEPEMDEDFISDLSFLSLEELKEIGLENAHQMFSKIGTFDEINRLEGLI